MNENVTLAFHEFLNLPDLKKSNLNGFGNEPLDPDDREPFASRPPRNTEKAISPRPHLSQLMGRQIFMEIFTDS